MPCERLSSEQGLGPFISSSSLSSFLFSLHLSSSGMVPAQATKDLTILASPRTPDTWLVLPIPLRKSPKEEGSAFTRKPFLILDLFYSSPGYLLLLTHLFLSARPLTQDWDLFCCFPKSRHLWRQIIFVAPVPGTQWLFQKSLSEVNYHS